MTGNRTVLVVDDDYDIRSTLTDILEDEGYVVATAGDGMAALAYLRTNSAPMVIVLDLMMPRCDGSEFRTKQLADPLLAAIPVVLLTADARAKDKVERIRSEDVLVKPVKLEALLGVLRRFVAQ